MKKYILIAFVCAFLFSLFSCGNVRIPDTVITVRGYIEGGSTIGFSLVRKGNGEILCDGDTADKTDESDGSITFRTANTEINIINDCGEYFLRRTMEIVGNITVLRQFSENRIILKTSLIDDDIEYTEEYYESGAVKLRTEYENGIIKEKFRYNEDGSMAKAPEYQ